MYFSIERFRGTKMRFGDLFCYIQVKYDFTANKYFSYEK